MLRKRKRYLGHIKTTYNVPKLLTTKICFFSFHSLLWINMDLASWPLTLEIGLVPGCLSRFQVAWVGPNTSTTLAFVISLHNTLANTIHMAPSTIWKLECDILLSVPKQRAGHIWQASPMTTTNGIYYRKWYLLHITITTEQLGLWFYCFT